MESEEGTKGKGIRLYNNASKNPYIRNFGGEEHAN
jgi:hypothetical protein